MKHEFSTSQAALQTWDSPSIFTVGSKLQTSSTQSWDSTPQKITNNNFLDSSTIKDHDIYHRLTQNNVVEMSKSADVVRRVFDNEYRKYLDHHKSVSGEGEGDSPGSENLKGGGTRSSSEANEKQVIKSYFLFFPEFVHHSPHSFLLLVAVNAYLHVLSTKRYIITFSVVSSGSFHYTETTYGVGASDY